MKSIMVHTKGMHSPQRELMRLVMLVMLPILSLMNRFGGKGGIRE